MGVSGRVGVNHCRCLGLGAKYGRQSGAIHLIASRLTAGGVALHDDPEALLLGHTDPGLIQSEEEGMEVVRLLGDGSAIILQGHGAVTTGHSLAQSVTAMLQLEEQVRMNYYAYCAMGREHPRIPEELIDEMTNRPPLHTLSHFQGVLQGRAPQRDSIWNYRVSRVSRDL